MAKKKYYIYGAHGEDFGAMCAELLDSIDPEDIVLRIVLFGSPADNAQYVQHSGIIRRCVTKHFGPDAPPSTYVAQQPLQCSLQMEVTVLDKSSDDNGAAITYGKDNYLVVEDAYGRELISGGIFSPDLEGGVLAQSRYVFDRIREILDKEGFSVGNIIRQWNYIEGITVFEGERQHYQDFNDCRSHFYVPGRWLSGYPAATGIGTQWGGIMVEINALLPVEGIVNRGQDNPLQIAAHSYSQEVLLGKEDDTFRQKTTPKFERARIVGYPADATVYVSGTAAIRGEKSMKGVDAGQQTAITMENIEYLCSPENINRKGDFICGSCEFLMLRVYVKNRADLGRVKEYMETHYPRVPVYYLVADVCREELLVEIEGVAIIS